MKNYTIQEISQQYDIPASTLRYYEDIGLLTCVERNENNQRIYNDNHIGQLNAITCFKRTGMPIAKIQKFFALSQNMDKNVDKILDLIYDHEANIQSQIAKMQDDLAHIRHKIRHYRGIKEAIESGQPWPRWEDFEQDEHLSNHEFFQVIDSIFEVFPMVVYVNLTQNKYIMLKQDDFLANNAPNSGLFDNLIDNGVNNIHPNYQRNFIQCFSRENLMQAFAQGKTDIYAELYQKGHDNNFQWVSTHVIRTKNHDSDICHICLNRILDGIQEKGGGIRR